MNELDFDAIIKNESGMTENQKREYRMIYMALWLRIVIARSFLICKETDYLMIERRPDEFLRQKFSQN